MEYLNTGGLFVSTIRTTEKSPDYFGSIKVDRSYLKFLMNSTMRMALKLSWVAGKSNLPKQALSLFPYPLIPMSRKTKPSQSQTIRTSGKSNGNQSI